MSYKETKYPIASMYGIFTYIYHKFRPNVGKYTVRPMDGMGVHTTQLKKSGLFPRSHKDRSFKQRIYRALRPENS